MWSVRVHECILEAPDIFLHKYGLILPVTWLCYTQDKVCTCPLYQCEWTLLRSPYTKVQKYHESRGENVDSSIGLPFENTLYIFSEELLIFLRFRLLPR